MCYQTDRVLRIIACLLLVFTSCTSDVTNVERPITINEAVEMGFPVCLPSSELIRTMNLDSPPLTIFEEMGTPMDEVCSSVKILFYRGDQTQNPVITMRVSNGCAYPFSPQPLKEICLEWTQNSTARVFESSEGHTILDFTVSGAFHYMIFSGETLTPTMEFLRSMECVH